MKNWVTLMFLSLTWLATGLGAQDRPEPVCSLSEDQTQKSIQAFGKLVPLFQHERCINCHGNVNPFDEEDGGHQGESFPADWRDKVDENGKPLANCSKGGCHTQLPGWRLAPDGMSFIDGPDKPKGAEDLCELMHRSFRYAKETTGEESFMGHMIRDNGAPKFIETALIGKRGMTDADLAPDKAEPPPIREHPQVVQLGQQWVDAMGGRFHGDTWCGCKKQSYVLRLDWEQTLNLNLGFINGQDKKTSGAPNKPGVDIPLTAKEPKVFTGEGRLAIRQQGQYMTGMGGCSGQGQINFDVKVTARIDEGEEKNRGQDDKMHVTFECKRADDDASGACPRGSGSMEASGCQANGVQLDFDPPTVGSSQSKEFPSPMPNSQTKMTATILKAP